MRRHPYGLHRAIPIGTSSEYCAAPKGGRGRFRQSLHRTVLRHPITCGRQCRSLQSIDGTLVDARAAVLITLLATMCNAGRRDLERTWR